MAYLSGYSYRKQIDLTGAAGLGTNAQVMLKIGATSSATGEDFDLGGRCDSFPTDIRFTDNDGSTELDFYHEKTEGSGDSALAYVWVEVADSLESSATIYIYYGKSGDSTGSNGDNTFILYEGFEDLTTGSALATQGGWTAEGGTATNLSVEANNPSEGSNSVQNTKNGDANAAHTFAATANIGLVFHIKVSDDGATIYPVLSLMRSADSTAAVTFRCNADGDFEYFDGAASQVDIYANYTANTYYRIEGRFEAGTDTGNWRQVVASAGGNGIFAGADSQKTTWATFNEIFLYTDVSENAYFDQIFIYKVATDGSAATYNTSGDEETIIKAPSLILASSMPSPSSITNLTNVNAATLVLTMTMIAPAVSESGGWDETPKNTADWTNLTKH